MLCGNRETGPTPVFSRCGNEKKRPGPEGVSKDCKESNGHSGMAVVKLFPAKRDASGASSNELCYVVVVQIEV
jgi:hypothetical protein